MVYNNLLHFLQHDCLLCHCTINSPHNFHGLCATCEGCISWIDHACPLCAYPLPDPAYTGLCGQCQSKTPELDGCWSVFAYEGCGINLVTAIKQKLHLPSMRTAAEMMARLGFPKVDLATPIPMPKEKDLLKGGNHSALLCKQLSSIKELKEKQVLTYNIKKHEQKQLGKQQRARQIRNAFGVKQPVKGLSILLVDDVITTGSTINEAARALKMSGAEKVYAASLARTL